MKLKIAVFTFLYLFPVSLSNLNASIINVPDEFEAIQEAIDESDDGDTVLVQPGEYVENIDFDGKAITVASLMLTTGSSAYIDSTVIDGNSDGSVVVFSSGEDENSILIGFTITNGAAENGGGISCINTGPTLLNLLIEECEASTFGGGVYGIGSSMTLRNVSLIRNRAGAYGGGFAAERDSDIDWEGGSVSENSNRSISGISIRWSSASISYLLVKNNRSGVQVTAYEIFGHQNDAVEFRNLNVLSDGSSGIGVSAEQPDVQMRNLIVRGHEHDNVHSNNTNLTYSNVEGEPDRNNCIDEDPLFVDPENGDYHLQPDSPCIDTGDPDSPNDTDGSRADMGAFPLEGGYVMGLALDITDDGPLAGATVRTSLGQHTLTDEAGSFGIRLSSAEIFDMFASLPGYNEEAVRDQQVEINDTLVLIFQLRHPEVQLSDEQIDIKLARGDSSVTELIINNEGNGLLTWQVHKRYPQGDPWDLRRSYPIGEITGDSRIEGVIFADDYFYISGASRQGREDGPNLIYKFDRDGNRIGSYEQSGDSNYGFRDLAYDGELIWGSGERNVYGFRPDDGELVSTFEGPYSSQQALAWDSGREILWMSGITSQRIVGCDRDGNQVAALPRHGFRMYAFACYPDDEDGYQLYIFHSPENSMQMIHKMDTETGDTMFVRLLQPEAGGSPGGAFVTSQYDSHSWVLINISNNGSDDRIDVWQVEGNMSWMDIEPTSGEVEADSSQVIELLIRTEELAEMEWEGEIVIEHNAAGGMISVPVFLRIESNSITEDKNDALPDEFGISAVYPNPFNSTTRISYSVPYASPVSITLFDLNGRKVISLANGDFEAGLYSVNLCADNLPAGLYIVRMQVVNRIFTNKVMLVR